LTIFVVSAEKDTYYPSDGPEANLHYDFKVSKNLNYALTVHFEWSDKLVTCTDPQNPPASQSYNMKLDKEIGEKVGLKALMINWNPCGHAPPGIFDVEHYDVHLYFDKNPQYKYTCGPFPENPICTPDNPDAAKFFVPVHNNLPIGFAPDAVGVGNMGLHHYVMPNISASEWIIPATVMGSYKGEVIFFETMVPKKTLAQGKPSSENIKYQNQTYFTLPSSVEFVPNNKDISIDITFKGQIEVECKTLSSDVCKEAIACSWKDGKCKSK